MKKTLKVVLPLLFGIALMFWIYRDFDFSSFGKSLSSMNWAWMTASLFFGMMSYIIRGIRWKILMQPMGVEVSNRLCVNAVNVAYMMNIVIPRVGEVSRCAILRKYAGVAFSKSLGTVVTERIIDMVCMLLMALLAVLFDRGLLFDFIDTTGLSIGSGSELLHSSTFYLVLLAVIAVCILAFMLLRRYTFWEKVKGVFSNIVSGALTVVRLRRPVLFVFYTVCIWLCYYLHFYLTFYSFDFLSDLDAVAGLVMFVLGSFSVIVPTPNGAGPWHYVVITAMIMYGIPKDDAGLFALVVHSIQTSLVVIMGFVSMFLLQFYKAEAKS